MIFCRFERIIAWRYLRPRGVERVLSVISAFAFIGIILGVATLIIVMSVMNGFRAELMGKILGINGHVTVYGQGANVSDYRLLHEAIKVIEGVSSATPLIEDQVIVHVNGRNVGAMVRGIEPKDFEDRPILRRSVSQTENTDFFNQKGVLVGARLADRLALVPGDEILIITPQVSETVFGAIPRMKKFKVADIFEVGLYQYDAHFIFMPLGQAQKFLRTSSDEVDFIEVVLSDPQSIKEQVAVMAEQINQPLRFYDWRQKNETLFDALKVERNVMFLILALMIVVAAFNIITSSIMLVKDKVRSIAILRTIGVERAAIMRIFFLNGAIIGCTGTVVGLALGTGIALNIDKIEGVLETVLGFDLFAAEIYFLSNLPSQVQALDIVAVAGLSLSLSFLATIYPSWRASQIDPVKILRHE